MIRYKTVEVTGVASSRKLEKLLSGIEGVTRHVVALWFQETTGTLNTDATLEAWIEQEQILQIPMINFFSDEATLVKLVPIRILLDLNLPAGKDLNAGITSGGTLSTFDVTVEYTE